jgi:hypothetical protein
MDVVLFYPILNVNGKGLGLCIYLYSMISVIETEVY